MRTVKVSREKYGKMQKHLSSMLAKMGSNDVEKPIEKISELFNAITTVEERKSAYLLQTDNERIFTVLEKYEVKQRRNNVGSSIGYIPSHQYARISGVKTRGGVCV